MADRLNMSLEQIARALGGEVSGGQVLAPGPNHSPEDGILAVKPGEKGLVVFSHAGDDIRACQGSSQGEAGTCLGTEKPKPTGPLALSSRNMTTATRPANSCSKSCGLHQRNSPNADLTATADGVGNSAKYDAHSIACLRCSRRSPMSSQSSLPKVRRRQMRSPTWRPGDMQPARRRQVAGRLFRSSQGREGHHPS